LEEFVNNSREGYESWRTNVFRPIVLSLVLLLGEVAMTPVWAATYQVAITDFTFTPTAMTVHAGDTIVWTNGDSVPHTATARDGKSFDTGTIDPNATGKVVFLKPGHYEYYCTVHPDMHGTVDVKQ
jgi:plastocyanin